MTRGPQIIRRPAFRHRRLVVVAATAALGAVALLAHSAQAPAITPPVGSCPDVAFIGARGSGESQQGHHGLGPTVDHIASRLTSDLAVDQETIRPQGVIYDALSTDTLNPSSRQVALVKGGQVAVAVAAYYKNNFRKYIASIHRGTAQLVDELHQTVANCPDANVVLAGYSQGAMVVHQAELQLARADDTDTLDAVVATILVADGDQASSPDARRFGSAPARGEGIRTYAHGNDRSDIPDGEDTAEVCTAGDMVCDFTPDRLRHAGKAIGVHTSYLHDRAALLDQATDWIDTRF